MYVESESFRLNFYSLSVVVESETEFNGVKTTLNLQEGINKKEYEKQTFVKTQFAKSKEQKDLIKTYFAENTERGDKKITTTFNIQNTNYAEVGIEFDDALYNKFESFKIDEIKNATYKIKVN